MKADTTSAGRTAGRRVLGQSDRTLQFLVFSMITSFCGNISKRFEGELMSKAFLTIYFVVAARIQYVIERGLFGMRT